MSKHTPGPWFFEGFVETETKSGWFVTVAPKRSISVEGRSENEAFANARLIAAAPELYSDASFALARLEDWESDHLTDDMPPDAVTDWLGHVTPALERLVQAIAKAEGRT
jgi:hypothetical protein